MIYETIQYAREGNIIIITLNRPQKLNALNKRLREELHHSLQKTLRDRDARVVIITGGNKFFSAGADIDEISGIKTTHDAYNFSRGFQNAFQEVQDFPLPTIAAISGYALGGGCELTLACDFRIAAGNARIGVPEVGLGALPAAGGTQRLPRILGLTKAKEMLYTGDPIDAQEAWRLGLVNKVVPADKLMDEARDMAKKLASRPKLALATIKSAVNTGINMDLSSALEHEAKSFATLVASHDFKEGIKAFLEKRKPVFTGK